MVLSNDGTWKYLNAPQKSYETRLDTPLLSKDKHASFLVKGQNVKYGIWIDPKKWKFELNTNESNPSEYIFTSKDQNIMSLVVAERIEVSTSLLVDAAIKHLRQVAEDVEIIRQETRKVNGHIVTYLELKGNVKGTKAIYNNYYYTGPTGTIQVICFTSQNLYQENKKEMETFLNGFDLLN